MATLKQKKLAQAVVDNLHAEEPLNKQELVRSAGYSELSADRRAKDILESDGVVEELVSFGFNPEIAKSVVSEILIGGENDTVKLKAADMVFKVHGTYAAEKHISVIVNVEETERVKQLADRLRKSAND